METRGRKKSVTEPAPPARDPRDVDMIERLHQRIQELEFQQLQQDSLETKSEPIIWDIEDEEEEYPIVNDYLSFKEEPIIFSKMNRVLFMTPIMKKKNRCRFMILILKMALRRKKDLLGKEDLVEEKTT
nr:hypothetical protein [Tanacetum cinerariifolium]